MTDITCGTCGITHDDNNDDVFTWDEMDFSDVPLLFPQVVLSLPCGHEMVVEDPDETDAEWRAFEMRFREKTEKLAKYNLLCDIASAHCLEARE